MLRSSASINDGCTIIWDHQVAGKQFDKKLNRKTRSKACSQQSLIFLENQAKICTILLWWWICLQEKSWLYTNICRMNHVMAFQGVVVSPWFHFFLLNYCYSSAMNQHYYNSITFSSHPKGKNAQHSQPMAAALAVKPAPMVFAQRIFTVSNFYRVSCKWLFRGIYAERK